MAAITQRRRFVAMQRQAQVDLSLRRLGRLAALEREHGYELNPAGLRLLRLSTFSVYCDCRALGIEDRARLLLGHRRTPGTPARATTELAATATG